MAKVAVKNYTLPGGDKTVIGGEIVIQGRMTIGDGAVLTGVAGTGAAVADTAATDVAGLVSAFNGLLAVLRAAGVIAPNAEDGE